jgi:hypothetical protein
VSRYILDTDTLSLYLREDVNILAAVVWHLADEVSISVINVEELWDGWRAAIRKAKSPDEVGRAYDRLTTTLNDLLVDLSLGVGLWVGCGLAHPNRRTGCRLPSPSTRSH